MLTNSNQTEASYSEEASIYHALVVRIVSINFETTLHILTCSVSHIILTKYRCGYAQYNIRRLMGQTVSSKQGCVNAVKYRQRERRMSLQGRVHGIKLITITFQKLNSNSDVTEVFLILSSYNKVSAMSALHYLSLVILTVHISSLCEVSRYYWTRDCSCTAVQSGRGLKCCVLNFSSLMRFPDIEY